MPAIGEFVPGYEASSVFGLGAPKDTPTEIIETLNKEANSALADSTFKMRLPASMLPDWVARLPISAC